MKTTNRIIKFRAWDEINKEMIGENYVLFGGLSTGDMLKRYENVMQFTGLLYNCNKEVYEGDILQSIVDKVLSNWIVSFKHGCFGIVNIGIDGYLGIFYPITSEYFFNYRVIIGNIHENKELLK